MKEDILIRLIREVRILFPNVALALTGSNLLRVTGLLDWPKDSDEITSDLDILIDLKGHGIEDYYDWYSKTLNYINQNKVNEGNYDGDLIGSILVKIDDNEYKVDLFFSDEQSWTKSKYAGIRLANIMETVRAKKYLGREKDKETLNYLSSRFK